VVGGEQIVTDGLVVFAGHDARAWAEEINMQTSRNNQNL